MRLQYFPDEDMLYISFRDVAGVESDELAEDVVVDYGEDGRAL